MNVKHSLIRIAIALVLVVALAVGLAWVAGCGGSGGPNLGGNTGASGGVVPVSQSKGLVQKDLRLAVYWAERSSNDVTLQTDAPCSALSFVLTLKDAAQNGSDYTFSANRRRAPAAYLETYKLPGKIRTGSTWASVEFYAGLDAQGDVVGVALAAVVLKKNGTGLEEITTEGTIASVEVPPGQTLELGETKMLICEVATANGQILAVTPGSIFWNVVDGEDYLELNGSEATGVEAGDATVTATVDGVRSDPQTVSVFDPDAPDQEGPEISIDPIHAALPCTPIAQDGTVTGPSQDIQILATDAWGAPQGWTPSVVESDGDLVGYRVVPTETPGEPPHPDEYPTYALRVTPQALPTDPCLRRDGEVRFSITSADQQVTREVAVTVYDPKILTAYHPEHPTEPVLELTWANGLNEGGAYHIKLANDVLLYAMVVGHPIPPDVGPHDPNQNRWYVLGSCATSQLLPGEEGWERNMPWRLNQQMTALAVREVHGAPSHYYLRKADQFAHQGQLSMNRTNPSGNYYRYFCDLYKPTVSSSSGFDALGLTTKQGPDEPTNENALVACIRTELTDPGRTIPISQHRWGNERHFLWGIAVPGGLAGGAALLSPGTITATYDDDGYTDPGDPPFDAPPTADEQPWIKVLKVNLPVLRHLKQTEEEEQRYLPSLRDLDTPPATLLPPVQQNSSLVPFTALADPDYSNAQGQRGDSPFYRVDRNVAYELIMHQVNLTAVTQRGVELSVKTGYSETHATERWKDYGIGVSAEFGYSSGALTPGASASVSVSFNHSWGESRTTSFTELEETTRTFRMDIPPQTAVALWQKVHRLSTLRHANGTPGRVAGTKYGLPSFYYAQYPPPGDLDAALSWVPDGVEILTPWGRGTPGLTVLGNVGRASAGRPPHQGPLDVLMRPVKPRARVAAPPARPTAPAARPARRATPPRTQGTWQGRSAFPTRDKGATR